MGTSNQQWSAKVTHESHALELEEGVFACIGGSIVCDDSTDTDLEICDGADNDCDGDVDEGIST